LVFAPAAPAYAMDVRRARSSCAPCAEPRWGRLQPAREFSPARPLRQNNDSSAGTARHPGNNVRVFVVHARNTELAGTKDPSQDTGANEDARDVCVLSYPRLFRIFCAVSIPCLPPVPMRQRAVISDSAHFGPSHLPLSLNRDQRKAAG
jgi:hypothetical protein